MKIYVDMNIILSYKWKESRNDCDCEIYTSVHHDVFSC